jgi:hypothetical protein
MLNEADDASIDNRGRSTPLKVAIQTRPSVAARLQNGRVLLTPCLRELVETLDARNRSSPSFVATQTLPSRSSRTVKTGSPDNPSDEEKVSTLPRCTWMSPWVRVQSRGPHPGRERSVGLRLSAPDRKRTTGEMAIYESADSAL